MNEFRKWTKWNLGDESSTEEIPPVGFLSGIRVKQPEIVAGVNTGENVN